MKTGIICAGDREAAPFLPMIEGDHIITKAMLDFHEGIIEGKNATILFSGVCKVNASIATQLLIDTFGCDVIINSGTAGGMEPSVHLLDTVISTEAAYHDVDEGILTDFHPWMESVYFKADSALIELAKRASKIIQPDGAVHCGRMVTGEQFIADENRDTINVRFSPLSVDMETAAIAHVCYVNRIPFLSVRTITDTAEHSGAETFSVNCDKASVISAKIVREMLKLM